MARKSLNCQTLISRDDRLSLRRQCELLGVNRSSVYYSPKAPDPAAVKIREELMARIDYWHTTLPYIGSRKIANLLTAEQFPVCRKTVRNLMSRMAIRAIYPKINLSKKNFKEATVPYLLRNYIAARPNQVWSIDITYIKLRHGHMFLTAIIDWYSRKIVGWNLADSLDTAYVIQAVTNAVAEYGKPEIINSDQGCQFTSKEYKEMLHKAGIRQSMDGKSRWADNIMIERWFRSLKTEKLYPNEFASPRELRRAIIDYIAEYNSVRPHEALGYKTPNYCFFEKRGA